MKRSFKPEGQPESPDEASSGGNSQNDDSSSESQAEQNRDTSDGSSNANNGAAGSLPEENCILFGRGKGTNNRPANRRMRSIIDRYRDEYQSVGRGEKMKLVRRVHDEIVEAGMKFFKPVDGGNNWIEVDAADAIKKVGHALRCNKNDNQRPREPDQPSQRNISDNSLLMQAGSALPHGGSLQGSAMASASAESSLLAQRNLTGMPFNMQQNLLVGNSLGLAGMPTLPSLGLSYPSLSLQSQLMEMEMNRLRSAASLPTGVAGSSFGVLGGLSAEQLRILIEREQQLRQMLLRDGSAWPRQFQGPPP